MKKTNFPAILEMDRQLYPGLPSEFLKGAHLPLLYRSVHTKNPLCEMNAFHLLCAHPECSLSPETILLVYSAMTKGTALQGAGYRKDNCYIDYHGVMYFPTSAEKIPQEMDALCKKYLALTDPGPEDAEDILRFLLEFICIHPVEDGNGRLSVFLGQLLLIRSGFLCASFLPWDYLQNGLHRELYQKHIIQASGMYYGQKPLEYDSYVRYVTELIAESYQLLALACKDLTGGEPSDRPAVIIDNPIPDHLQLIRNRGEE